jgi:hypothetical protein
MSTLTPPSAAKSWETTTTTTTMATTIASPTTIESTGAATVLVPHGAELPLPPPSPAADSTLSPLSDPALSANAPTHAPSNATDAPTYASFFVLGRGWRDDGADGIVVIGGNGGARSNVHRGRRGSADDYGDADCDDILCLTKLYLIFIYIYHYVDRANHAFGGPNHDDSVRVNALTTTPTP